MASPFPGMDPYLEGARWPGFHHDLATEIKRQLMPKLLPRYFADTTMYFLIDSGEEIGITQERVSPDVSVVKGKGKGSPSRKVRSSSLPVVMVALMPLEVPHFRVAIRDVEKRRLITAIEFLSPTNKQGEGRHQYLEKRNKILVRPIHLVEIDLLRRGTRLPTTEPLPAGSYYVFVSRWDQRPNIRVWPVALAEPLPSTIPIPLKKKGEEVPLDLQKAVHNVYDLGGYEQILDYQEPPRGPLPEEEEAWADQLLREKGFRK